MKEMEKRITKRSDGRYRIDFGYSVDSQPNPIGIGYIMKGFIVYKSTTCNTLRQAQREEY